MALTIMGFFQFLAVEDVLAPYDSGAMSDRVPHPAMLECGMWEIRFAKSCGESCAEGMPPELHREPLPSISLAQMSQSIEPRLHAFLSLVP